MRLPRNSISCILMALLLAACSANGQNWRTDTALTSYASAAPVRGSDGPYRLGPGDRLQIRAYDDQNLSGIYEVDSAGFVSVPLVGQIKASGLTTSQLEKSIKAKMKGGIAKNPKINIEVATYAPFYIYGEVKKAGFYPYQPGLTVADAIATAGGLTYRADENAIYIQHAASHTQQAVRLNVPARVYPGDNIRVSERIF